MRFSKYTFRKYLKIKTRCVFSSSRIVTAFEYKQLLSSKLVRSHLELDYTQN
jgi:hypothetical protein